MKTTKQFLIIGILVFLLINLTPTFFYLLYLILLHPAKTILIVLFTFVVILLINEIKKQFKNN